MQRITVGEFEVTLIMAGAYHWDGGALFGVVPKTLWGKHLPADERNLVPMAFNCFLVETGEHTVLIETGGYVSTEEVDSRAKIILDVKCPASGEAERNHWPNLNRLRKDKDEVKFVIADATDWEFARRIIADYQLESRAKAILISPAWDQIDLQELANWIVQSGVDIRMQLQLHKYIWGPDVHGV